MGLAAIDLHSRKSTPRFTKCPSLVLIRLVLTEIQPFQNVKINKEMYGHRDNLLFQEIFQIHLQDSVIGTLRGTQQNLIEC